MCVLEKIHPDDVLPYFRNKYSKDVFVHCALQMYVQSFQGVIIERLDHVLIGFLDPSLF